MGMSLGDDDGGLKGVVVGCIMIDDQECKHR